MPETRIAKGFDAIADETTHTSAPEQNTANTAAEADPGYRAMPPITEPQSLERSQWERLSLGPNLELHIRRPLSRPEQRRVDRLITIARQVLNEDQS